MLKISYGIMQDPHYKYHARNRKKPIRRGYCQVCGSKLSNPDSIERGIGSGCLAKRMVIVLEMIPDA